MKFKRRDAVAEKILRQCAEEGKSVLVTGKGFYLDIFENYVQLLAELHYPGFVFSITVEPALKISFHGGGFLIVQDYTEQTDRLHAIGPEVSFHQFVVVEDEPGTMISEFREIILPLMAIVDDSKLIMLGGTLAGSAND